jgi:SAM-dependent methyltransferase
MGTPLKTVSKGYPHFRRLIRWIQKVVASVKRNSFRKTLQNIASAIEDAHFDWSYRIETARLENLENLNISSVNKRLGERYEPVRVRAFRKLMDHLRLPSGLVFIDMGCGKGRPLIAAAEYPFRRIVGVEFSPELCAICRENIASARKRKMYDAQIEIIETDAAEFSIPSDASVLFLLNPFHSSIFMRVLENLHISLAQAPRTVWIIIGNPQDLAPTVNLALDNFTWISEYTYGSAKFWIWSNDRTASYGSA